VADAAPLEARWIVAEFHATAATVNASLESYRYDDAANTIYQFFWGSFCDWYLEIVKLRLDFSETADKAQTQTALTTLLSVFEASLRLLSPFMPFITEEIWHALYDGNPPAKSIAMTNYPVEWGDVTNAFAPSGLNWYHLQLLVTDIRAQRKDRGVSEKEIVPLQLSTQIYSKARFFESQADIIRALGRVSEIQFVSPEVFTNRSGIRNGVVWDIDVVYEKQVDVAAERERLTKDIAKYEKGLVSAERQLGNEAFLSKAPPQVVEGLKKQEAEMRLLLDKARTTLENLNKGK